MTVSNLIFIEFALIISQHWNQCFSTSKWSQNNRRNDKKFIHFSALSSITQEQKEPGKYKVWIIQVSGHKNNESLLTYKYCYWISISTLTPTRNNLSDHPYTSYVHVDIIFSSSLGNYSCHLLKTILLWASGMLEIGMTGQYDIACKRTMKRSDPIMEKIKTFKIKRFPPELTQQWTELGHWAKGIPVEMVWVMPH